MRHEKISPASPTKIPMIIHGPARGCSVPLVKMNTFRQKKNTPNEMSVE